MKKPRGHPAPYQSRVRRQELESIRSPRHRDDFAFPTLAFLQMAPMNKAPINGALPNKADVLTKRPAKS